MNQFRQNETIVVGDQPAQHRPQEAQVQHLSSQLHSKNSQLQRACHQLIMSEQDNQAFADGMDVLKQMARLMASPMAMSELLDGLAQCLVKLDADVLLLGLLAADKQKIELPLFIQQGQEQAVHTVAFDDPSSLIARCIAQQKAMTLQTSQALIDQLGSGIESFSQQMQSMVYEPLIIKGQVKGCLSIQSTRTNAYTPHQLELFATIANYVAIAITNAQADVSPSPCTKGLDGDQQQLLLKDKMASLGTLTAGVAHEINNPANFVHVGVELLGEELQAFEDWLVMLANEEGDEDIKQTFREQFERLHEHVETIESGSNRIRAIVGDLRAFTHIDSKEKSWTDLTQCTQSTLGRLKTAIPSDTRVIRDFQSLPQIKTHPAQINQMLMNILLNACDAIKLRQFKEKADYQGQIVVRLSGSQQRLSIAIEDNGVGMTIETKNRLFEPFYTTKVVGEGTGLGMAIVFSIIKALGGEIEVASEPMSGCCITLHLPRL